MTNDLRRTCSRITYRFQSHDIKVYYFNHVVNRMRAAVVRAGGELQGGIHNLPRKIQRWTLLRSPHVNKKSREKFWVVNRLRLFRWDAPANIDPDAHRIISETVPASVAVRSIVNDPGLRALKSVFDTIQQVNSNRIKTSQAHTGNNEQEEQQQLDETTTTTTTTTADNISTDSDSDQVEQDNGRNKT